MQRNYRVELADVWRGTLSLRRLRVLIEQLPPDSATARAVAGVDDPFAAWSLGDVLLARVLDELSAYRWQWETAHVEKRSRLRKPPTSVLPDMRSKSKDADVIPIVSPHRLSSFVNEQEGA